MTILAQVETEVTPSPAGSPRGRFLSGIHIAWIFLLPLVGQALMAQAPGGAPKSIQELRAFYQQNCTRCHGADGAAKGADGKQLAGADFIKAATTFRTLGSPASERELQAMVRTIRKGILFGITMPAWGQQLSQEDATLMVREVLLKAESGKAILPLEQPTH